MERERILTHRGLEPSKEKFYPESSYEALENHLSRGFGIEFDPNFAADGIVVSHDANLKRITNGKDERSFSEVSISELKSINYGGEVKGRIATFSEVMELIRKSSAKLSAMHLKGVNQDEEKLDLLLKELKKNEDLLDRFIIFDLKPEAARYLKGELPSLKLAPSVAHSYDIKRYNGVVRGTLFSIDEVLRLRDIYDWVWLDEWDLADSNGGGKKFYTAKTFDVMRNAGYKIGLVTPELHGTSPGLYGGESHADASNKERLFTRIKEIASLKPDFICTDYPEECTKI